MPQYTVLGHYFDNEGLFGEVIDSEIELGENLDDDAVRAVVVQGLLTSQMFSHFGGDVDREQAALCNMSIDFVFDGDVTGRLRWSTT